jgi:hemerythrin-like domain-containing protein
MKRSEALASLSRDHHQALVVARKLRRATEATGPQARETFLAYWIGHGRLHFRLEEELLFPAYAGYGDPHDPRVVRALDEHATIRHLAKALAASPAATPAELEQLGADLAAHVRFEEREVFPMIERLMPSDELNALAERLEGGQST